jgi:homoserine dehydrogenase
MRIAIFGYGGVGKALVRLIEEKREELKGEGLKPEVNYVIEYYGGIYAKEGIELAKLIEFTQSGEKDITRYEGGSKEIDVDTVIENGDVDLAVIMTPTNKETGEPGLGFIRKLLGAGINVVTSDKGPVLLAYEELKELAKEKGVQLGIGCTTGGALPTVNGGMMDMAGAKIKSIEGVLNGTTNFILKDMEERGVSYEEALKKAQEDGIAETNPSLDVEGYDTATKLLILTKVHMGITKSIEEVEIEGITKVTQEDIRKAKEEGKKYRLVGRTEVGEDGEVKIRVSPEKVGQENIFYSVEGKNKAVRYTSDTLGDLVMIGGASGTTPAAASILRDVINIHRGYKFVR